MTSSKALVLKTLKHGENRLIVHLYTEKLGILHAATKLTKTNKNAWFALNEIEISWNHNPKKELHNLSRVETYDMYKSLHTHPVKGMMVQFLGEMLHIALKEESPSETLYAFLVKYLRKLDQYNHHFADFHLIFLLQLTRFLGFYPNLQNQKDTYFDLANGDFTALNYSPYALNETQTLVWKKLLQKDETTAFENPFTLAERKELLEILLRYYQIHLPEFRNPKSLEILKVVLA